MFNKSYDDYLLSGATADGEVLFEDWLGEQIYDPDGYYYDTLNNVHVHEDDAVDYVKETFMTSEEVVDGERY